MELLRISLFFHFVGLGLISTTLVGGWILSRQYKSRTDWKEKELVLKSLRPIGLLSPVSILVLLLSGIGNMYALGLGLFTERWLTEKLVLFVLAVVSGIVSGAKGSRRSRLVAQMADGNGSEDVEASIRSLDRQQRAFYVLNICLIALILGLSIVKPQ